jgi:hypothetical protein
LPLIGGIAWFELVDHLFDVLSVRFVDDFGVAHLAVMFAVNLGQNVASVRSAALDRSVFLHFETLDSAFDALHFRHACGLLSQYFPIEIVLPHRLNTRIIDEVILFIIKTDFAGLAKANSRKSNAEYGKITTPSGESAIRGGAPSESIFELTTASPVNRFTHSLPLLALSMIWVFSRCGNIRDAYYTEIGLKPVL